MSASDGQIDPHGISAYTDYRGGNAYETVTGVLVMPTCDGAGPVAIQVHDPYRIRRSSYGGVGRGRPTVMPRPRDTDKVLTHTHVQQLPVPFQSGEGDGY